MTNLSNSSVKLAVYSADVWEHACPVMRMTGPAQAAGFEVLRGNDWIDGELQYTLDPIEQAEFVVVLRDFPRHEEIYRQVVARARELGKKIVYSTDDLLIDVPADHPKTLFYRRSAHPILQAVMEADALIVSTPALGDYLRTYNERVWVLPNYLDDQLWEIQPPRAREDPLPIVIGFQGGDGHKADLEYIAPAIIKILEHYGKRVKFQFWGIRPPENILQRPNVAWDFVGLVSYAEFVEFFQRQECDLFVAPLVDTWFNACKSPLKFYEYSALGIPGVYSRVAPFQRVVEDGKNGLLASSLKEWDDQMTRLIEDAEYRRQLGAAAQESVKDRWLLSSHGLEWRQAFSEIQALPAQKEIPAILQDILTNSHRWVMGLGDRIDEQEQALEENAAVIQRKQSEIYRLQSKIQQQQSEIGYLKTDLNNIQSSVGWSALMLVHRVFDRLFPPGSLQGRAMGSGLKTLKRMLGKGPRVPLTQTDLGEKFFSGDKNETISLLVKAQTGQMISSPGISIIIPCGPDGAAVEDQALAAWLAGQTYQDVEVVTWEYTQPDQARLILAGLKGKYVCAASPDLVTQSPTYLETNLVALESEALLFTLNALGKADWMVDKVSAGSLPGSPTLPLLRQIVRKDSLDENFALDLSKMGQQSQRRIVGKLIVHTASQMDDPLSLVYHAEGSSPALSVLDRYLCLRASGDHPPSGPMDYPVYEVNTVLPAAPLPSDLPTVVVVMPFLAVGGAETIHIHAMRHLKDRMRFVVLTFEKHDSALGTTVEEFRKITPYIYLLPDFLLNHLNFSMVQYLLARFNPQTLYVANGATWIYNALEEITRSRPSMRVVNQVYDHQAGWINRYDSTLAKKIDIHISSNYQIDKAYVQRGVRPEQVRHIENGVDLDAFDPGKYSDEKIRAIKTRFGIPPEKKLVTFIARLHPQKRPVDFIEMARRCVEDTSMAFLMVGDGPLANTVEEELQRTDLKNFHRLSFYKPSSDVFAISNVIVLTSEYEGMPMAVLEALAMGRPVVATDVGNIREVLEKTGGGSVVSTVGDINGLIAAVKQVLSNQVDVELLRKRVEQHYSLQQMADSYGQALLKEA